MAKTNKLGLSLRRKKKRFFGPKIVKKIESKGQKLTNSQKKRKRTFQAKNQAWAELKKKKKNLLGQKLGGKLGIMSRN